MNFDPRFGLRFARPVSSLAALGCMLAGCSSGGATSAPIDAGTDTSAAAGPGIDGGRYTLLDYSLTTAPRSVAVDGTNVFWSNTTEGAAIYRIPETARSNADAGLDTLLAKAPFPSPGIAVDSTNVYWTAGTSQVNGVFAVAKGADAGGTVVTLASEPSSNQVSVDGALGNSGVAVDDTSVYYVSLTTTLDSLHNMLQGGLIESVPKTATSAGTPTTLATSTTAPPSSIALDASNVYWVGNTMPKSAASPVIASVPKAGGTVTTLLAGAAQAANEIERGCLVVDASNLYWVEQDLGTQTYTVQSMPLAGGTATTLATATTKEAPNALALDGTTLYWSTGHSLVKVPVTGGTPSTFATDFPFPTAVAPTFGSGGIVVDSTSVYFTLSSPTYAYGYVLKTAKQ